MAKKKTAVQIMNEDMEEMAASAQDMVKEIIEQATPKTPLEAAFDRATGFKPEDAVKAILGTEKPNPETDSAETGTEKPETETDSDETETAATDKTKRDWVKEAYECFVKDAKDIDPTDPVKAIKVYFEKNATDELKARCKSEGKDAEGCWEFIEAVARKALHGSSGHIDPAVVYAIAMHWFEDVPKDWDKAERSSAVRTAKPAKKRKSKTQAAAAKAKAAKQGFFFEMLETPAGGGAE